MTDRKPSDEAGERIRRLRRHFQTAKSRISVERAQFYTEKWRELENRGVPLPLRVALSMKHVYENMTHAIYPDDRLAGNWTEFSLGWPIDIERGCFNDVLATELDRLSLARFQLKSYARFVRYLLKKRGPLGLVRILRQNAALGPTPVNVGLQTLETRRINAFTVDPEAKRLLHAHLLPYWRGRALTDKLFAALEQSDIYNREMADFVTGVPNTPSKQVALVSVGASLAAYQGHLVLDQERVLRRGLLAMLREAEENLAESPTDDEAKRTFRQSVVIALEGLIVFASRLAREVERQWQTAVEPQRQAILADMLAACRRAPLKPARTFREAVQGLWTLRVALELAHPDNVHAPGRLDQILFRYYDRDLRQGRITREAARELLEEFLLKTMTHQIRPESNFLGNFYLRYEGSTPVTLGGRRTDGRDATNELTYVLLEAADRAKSVTSIVLRVHEQTPEDLYLAAAEILSHGTANLSLMNDEVFIPALRNFNIPLKDARNYAVTGCTDLTIPGKSGGLSFSGLLLVRTLDLALRNGDAQTMIGPLRGIGPRTGDPDTFASFTQLVDAFIAQADHQLKLNVEASNLRDRLFAENLPAPHLSAFIAGCAETATDITQGGAVFNMSGVNMINSLANVVDSLYALKKLVYEEKRYTVRDVLAAVDANFIGHEKLHREILDLPGKWGNAAEETDRLAYEISSRLFAACRGYRAYKGGGFAPFLNSMTAHTVDGRMSGATPDGRRAATPFASSCNPYQVEKTGVTGVLKSVSALDNTHQLGCAVNIKQHPSCLGRTPAAQRKWISLVRTYFRLGGAQLQPTVASTDSLRAAQREPEAYRDLIVKVGGYSTYFVDLGREIQNEIINRTEHDTRS